MFINPITITITIISINNHQQLTLADLRAVAIFHFYQFLEVAYDESKFPELIKLRDHVLSLPKLQHTDANEK